MHYVYYLLDPYTRDLLYIGRSERPRKRLVAFYYRTQREAIFGVSQRHSTLEAASRAELKAIAKHQPPFNRMLISSSGFIGSKHSSEAKTAISQKNKGHTTSLEHREKIRASLMGRSPTKGMTGKKHPPEAIAKLKAKVVTADTRLRMRQSALGRKLSDAAKAKLSKANIGKVFSSETRARISAGVLAAKERNQNEIPSTHHN